MQLSQRARKAGLRDYKRPAARKLQRKMKSNISRRKGRRITAGRPQKWNRERLFNYVTERMRKGELVTYVMRKIHCDYGVLMQHIRSDSSGELAKRWQEAKAAQARAIADHAMRIADGRDGFTKAIKKETKRLKSSGDPHWREKVKSLESGRIARNNLQVRTRQWFTKVTAPQEFGDKVDHTSGGEPLAPAQSLTVQFVKSPHKES